MLFQAIFFYLFAITTLFAAVGVVFLKNPVHSALSLVVAFFASACLWLILQAEFLALILILVYVGAVMTLFLFVVMTIDLDLDIQKQTFVRYFPLGLTLIAILGSLLIFILKPVKHLIVNQFVLHGAQYSNTEALGSVLYTDYVYPFELAAILLLIAIIAAISLNPHKARSRKTQNIDDQVHINRADRMRLVKIPSEENV